MNMTSTILALAGLLAAAVHAVGADGRLPYPPSALMDGFSIEPERVSIGDGDNWGVCGLGEFKGFS